jgi:ankyrin repeat protein
LADAVETESTSWLTAVLLVGGDPNVDAVRWSGERDTALGVAAFSGHEDGVRLLLQFGADPNKEQGAERSSALAVAVRHPAIVALLLEKGADVNGTRADGCWNPLEWAGRIKDIESMRLLLDFGADPSRAERWPRALVKDTRTACVCCWSSARAPRAGNGSS